MGTAWVAVDADEVETTLSYRDVGAVAGQLLQQSHPTLGVQHNVSMMDEPRC